MRVNAVSLALMLGAAASVACGGPSASNSGSAGAGNGSAGSSNGGAGGTVTSAGGSGGGSAAQAGSGGSTTGGAADTTHWGQVMVQSLISGASRVSVSAQFVSNRGSGPQTPCNRVTEGPCVNTVCDEAPASEQATLYASAGTVTVTSTEISGTATLEPGATNQYPTLSTSPFASDFLGGEHIQIKAAGATVPAFQDELSVPLVLLLSQPLFVKDQPSLDAPRSQDLSLVWTRGAKDVYLYLTAGSVRSDGSPGRAYLTCQIPSETGSAVIKSTMLQTLTPDTQLSLFTIGAKIITAGEYSITLATTLPAANPDKVLVPRITLK